MSWELEQPDFVVPPGITLLKNTHNFVPRPIRPATESEFFRQFHTYGAGRQLPAHHQVYDAPGFETEQSRGPLQTFYVFWYSSCAFGMLISYGYEPNAQTPGAQQVFRPHYFRIGCEHRWERTYQPKGPRDHWNEYTCQDCGYVNKYDSSG